MIAELWQALNGGQHFPSGIAAVAACIDGVPRQRFAQYVNQGWIAGQVSATTSKLLASLRAARMSATLCFAYNMQAASTIVGTGL